MTNNNESSQTEMKMATEEYVAPQVYRWMFDSTSTMTISDPYGGGGGSGGGVLNIPVDFE